MSDRSPPVRIPTPERREQAAALLCDYFASGHLELDALEARLAAVDRARSEAEIDEQFRDLPALAAPPPAVAEARSERGWALALLGGNSRKGVWTPPRRLYALAAMGGVELDFRDARLPPGETHVTAVALMGGIDITVPPGLPVTVRGLGILGGVDQVEEAGEGAGPNVPRLIITALALMGGVGVETRASERAKRIASKANEKRR